MKNKKKCGLLNSFFFFQFNQIAQTTDPICFIDSYVYIYNQFDFIVLLPMKKSSVFPLFCNYFRFHLACYPKWLSSSFPVVYIVWE